MKVAIYGRSAGACPAGLWRRGPVPRRRPVGLCNAQSSPIAPLSAPRRQAQSCRTPPGPAGLGWPARIHQDQRDAPWAPSLLPGAWPGPCNNADLTSRVMPRQPVQHRLSLSITGHRQSRPLFKYVILQALQGRKRDRETCSANFIASFTNRRRVIISPFRLLPRIRVRTAHNGY